MGRAIPVVVFLVLGALHGPAMAAAGDGNRTLVAVLDLASESPKVTEKDAQFLSQEVRAAVANAFDPARYHVMTTAEMFMVATPEQMQQCAGEQCILKIGQTLQADVVIGGRVTDVGSMIGVMFEAYGTHPGGLLASPTARAKNVDELVAIVKQEAERLVIQVLQRVAPDQGNVSRPSSLPVVSPEPVRPRPSSKPDSDVAWLNRAEDAARAIFAGRSGQDLAKVIQEITHPAGKAPRLLDEVVSRVGSTLVAKLTVGWRPGLTGKDFVTIVEWRCSERQDLGMSVVSDTAPSPVSPGARSELERFFKRFVYSRLESDAK